MISILLGSVSAAAITARLVTAPLVWVDLAATGVNSNSSSAASTGRTYVLRYDLKDGTKVKPVTKVRVSFVASANGPITLSKVYIGELVASRSGYVFQSTPVAITFDGGSASVTIAAGASKTSDEMTVSFSGCYSLGVAFILSAITGSQRRIITAANWSMLDISGDQFPDPPIASYVTSSNSAAILNDIDVVYGHFLSAGQLRASMQNVHIVKEGFLPSLDNQIKAVNQVVYIVKG